MNTTNRIALLGVADGEIIRQLESEILRLERTSQLPVATSTSQMRARLRGISPSAILLDEGMLGSAPLSEIVREMSAIAPLVVMGSPDRQSVLAQFIVSGEVEFVARTGSFVPVAAALVVRRMRWAEASAALVGPPWQELPSDLPEVLRHEINNPLTGILGNAELVLSLRDRLPPSAVQRLETVVELTVRLRETVRRLSHAWAAQQRPVHSAQQLADGEGRA